MTREMRELEIIYENVLSDIAKSFGVSTGDTDAQRIEQLSVPRLKPVRVWLISGISGSGKSTIIKMLDAHGYRRLPNVLTRPKRPEESEADNIFVTREVFAQMEKRGELFHPHITNGVHHAIREADMRDLSEGKKSVYMDKSVPSVRAILERYPHLIETANFLFVLAPSFGVLRERIEARENAQGRTDILSATEIASRFGEEIAHMGESLHVPYAYIVNDSLERVEKVLTRYVR